MKIIVSTVLSGTTYTFHIDDGKDLEALHRAAVFGNPPQYCNECKNNQHFKLDSNKDKEANIYVNVICRKCGAKAKLGQYKAGGYFWRSFEKYQKNDAGNTPQEQQQSGAEPPIPDDDDLPF